MINKQAELQKLAILYVACKGILRVKQVGLVKQAGWWDNTKTFVKNRLNDLGRAHNWAQTGYWDKMKPWQRIALMGGLGMAAGATMPLGIVGGAAALPLMAQAAGIGGLVGAGIGGIHSIPKVNRWLRNKFWNRNVQLFDTNNQAAQQPSAVSQATPRTATPPQPAPQPQPAM